MGFSGDPTSGSGHSRQRSAGMGFAGKDADASSKVLPPKFTATANTKAKAPHSCLRS